MTVVSAGIINEATGPAFPEDFERSSPLDDYTGGLPGNWEITTTSSEVWSGSAALANRGTDFQIIYADGWSETVELDKTYRIRMMSGGFSDSYARICFFASGTDRSDFTGYHIEVQNTGSTSNDDIRLDEATNGTDTNLAINENAQVNQDEYHFLEFSVDSSTSPNTIRAEWFREDGTSDVTLSAQDDTHTSGVHAFDAVSNGPDMFWDNLQKISDTPQSF